MAETNASGGETRYKIGDVCRIADVQPYVLRYWESEFPVLAPDKSAPGPRTYSARELKLIEQIKRLLYDEGYTIAGAKKRLEGDAGGRAEAREAKADTHPVVPPVPESPVAKAATGDAPQKGEKAAPRAPRPAKSSPAAFSGVPEIERPAPEITKPAPQAPADPRVARAVAELKEVLALLSRPLA
ncbi:MAG: MerR family transcriptional regulator [Thermoanaerobaculia bacterium]